MAHRQFPCSPRERDCRLQLQAPGWMDARFERYTVIRLKQMDAASIIPLVTLIFESQRQQRRETQNQGMVFH